MSYRLSPQANKDIESVCDYIAERDPVAADRLEDRIHEALKLLAQLPGMGHTRSDVSDARYRFWAVGKYIIAYRFYEELIVVRVVHGARDFRELFDDET